MGSARQPARAAHTCPSGEMTCLRQFGRELEEDLAIRPEYEEERLRAIRHIALILRDLLTPRGVGQF